MLIKEYAPVDHKIRKDGRNKAYEDLHALGAGIETSCPLERVEIDLHTRCLLALQIVREGIVSPLRYTLE